MTPAHSGTSGTGSPPGDSTPPRASALRRLALVEREHLAANGPARTARWNAHLLDAWLRDRLARRSYTTLDEAALRARRRSDTVFVFGSGASLNDITDAEWAGIGRHDVFGFNDFIRQRWVPAGFHLLRGGVYGTLEWRPYAEQVAGAIAGNPCYRDTAFLLQGELLGDFSNRLVGHRLLPPGAAVFRYTTARGSGPPTRRFADGLRHGVGTLEDVVNAAWLLGWREIVLTGIDLYDSRYFWLPPDRTQTVDPATGTVGAGERNSLRGQRFDEPHNTARSGVVDLMASWGALLAAEGVRLSVYNPRSLLAGPLPVYERETAQARSI